MEISAPGPANACEGKQRDVYEENSDRHNGLAVVIRTTLISGPGS
jgi:hypothetical protein